MSENHDEPNHEAAGNGTPRGELQASRKRFEDERMTRREALRRIGLMMGMATFAMLSVDDLARFSAKKLQEHEVSKGIGDSLANEFRSAGVAFANPSGPPPPDPSGPPPDPSGGSCDEPNPSGMSAQGAGDSCDSCTHACNVAHKKCSDGCYRPPGCQEGGGSAWPWCVGYNLCLIGCGTQHRVCQEACPDEG